MTDQYAIDIATARPSAADIKASGYTAVVGYLSGGLKLSDLPKDMPTKYEDELLSAGLGTGRVWETTADAALGGSAQGNADGAACLAECQGKLAAETGITEYPAGSPLWLNVGDFAATPEQIPVIGAYYGAFFKACPGYDQGGYGTGYIIDQLVKAGYSGTWWQNAMDDQGVPGSNVSPWAAMYQRVTPTRPPIPGGGYDEDVYGFGPNPPRWRMEGPLALAAPLVTGSAQYKLELHWPPVPGADGYQYQVERRDVLHWTAIVRDARTSATEVIIPVSRRGVYQYRAATPATATRPGSPWSEWMRITI